MNGKILERTQINQQFSQNAKYFLLFQHNQLVSHLCSLKLEKRIKWEQIKKSPDRPELEKTDKYKNLTKMAYTVYFPSASIHEI